jgi:hypothetical protein
MGAGISLGEYQISELVRRELNEYYQKRIENMSPCAKPYEHYRNVLEKQAHVSELRAVERCEKHAIQIKTKTR